jgi:5-formyltetrahydrofolate cyclo-ligase
LLLWFESNGPHRHRRVAPPDSSAASGARRQLRARLNAQRRALAAHERAALAQRIARNADRAVHLRNGWRIALYAPLPWELDPTPLRELARSRGCQVYLPCIERQRASREMSFVAAEGAVRANRLGIDEPQGSVTLPARWLDLVFLPLVGFSRGGLRLGSGGGYYDRAFAFRQLRRVWHAPRLIGLAYAFQEIEGLMAAPHDVLLDAVVTEEGMIRCTTG